MEVCDLYAVFFIRVMTSIHPSDFNKLLEHLVVIGQLKMNISAYYSL